MAFLVFTATHVKRQSSSVYLASLALADLSFLLALTVVWLGWINVPLFHKRGWCQTVVYITYVSTFLSVWLVVSFTIERYVIVRYPLRKDRFCTLGRARRVVTSLTLCGLVLYSFAPWTSGIVHIRTLPVCMPLPQHYVLFTTVTAIDSAINLIIPSCTIVVLNIRMAYKIVKVTRETKHLGLPNSGSQMESLPDRRATLYRSMSLNRRNSHRAVLFLTGTNSTHARQSLARMGSVTSPSTQAQFGIAQGRVRAQYRTARMLIIVSSVFVILNVPSHVFRIHAFLYTSLGDRLVTSKKALRWQELFQLLYHLNFSINFILYSLYGRQFRTGLKLILSRTAHRIRKCCLGKAVVHRHPQPQPV